MRGDVRGTICEIASVIFLAFILLFFASGAHAANILINHDVCSNITATPAPDVEYKPGTEAGGKAVAPADVPNSTMPWPQDIQIPLQLNLQNALHLPQNSNLTSPQAVVGTIEYKNGQLTFNGQPISDEARANIQQACDQNRATDSKPIITHKNLLRGD